MSDPIGEYVALLADDAAMRPYRLAAGREALAALAREIKLTSDELSRARVAARRRARALPT